MSKSASKTMRKHLFTSNKVVVKIAEDFRRIFGVFSNCEILKAVFQPRVLSSDIPASKEGFPFFFLISVYVVYCVCICYTEFE